MEPGWRGAEVRRPGVHLQRVPGPGGQGGDQQQPPLYYGPRQYTIGTIERAERKKKMCTVLLISRLL